MRYVFQEQYFHGTVPENPGCSKYNGGIEDQSNELLLNVTAIEDRS